MTQPRRDGLAVYVHWPFCVSKCPYCDFNSHVSDTVDHHRWRRAFADELAHYAGVLPPGRPVTSIFFGGGTPSLMEPRTVAFIIETIGRLWPVDADVEITAEANPGSVDQAVFAGFAAAGVNRVSIGIQSFDQTALRFLGRKHDAAEAYAAVDLAAQYFPRFSFDLIYARPNQTAAAWETELRQALQLGPAHLSAYQLTIEQGTKFETLHRQGAFDLPDGDLAADLYKVTGETLDEAGLQAYEVSNYAVPGQESRHNLAYWRYGDYLGIGPGAHGRVTRDGSKYATRAHRAPDIWLTRVEAQGHGAYEPEALNPVMRLQELLLMGLRLREPISHDRIVEETGRGLSDWIDPSVLRRLENAGYLMVTPAGIAATQEGRIRLSSVLDHLIQTGLDHVSRTA